MPYASTKDVPVSVPEEHKKQWMEVWNSVHAKALADKKSPEEAEKEAFMQANGVIKKDDRSSQEPDMEGRDLMKLSMEYRACAELRAAEGSDLKIVGYAAIFNTPSKDLGGFRETVAPGAFTRALEQRQDVKCLFNHSADHVLGRVGNGTLSLVQDERGLRFECQLDPNQQAHRDLHASVKRGDINECSFAFKAPEKGQKWETRKDEKGNYYAARTLTDVDLFDVSAVTYPAYNTTSVFARSITPEIRNQLLQLRAEGGIGGANDDSYEDQCREISRALAEAFPVEDSAGPYASCGSGRYWICETYTDYVIASDSQGDGDYVRIPYAEVADDEFKFGTPVKVEKEWVASERAQKVQVEVRKVKSEHVAALAGQHADDAAYHKNVADAHTDAADAHAHAAETLKAAAEKKEAEEKMDAECRASMGDCAYEKHSCQNVMVEKRDVWDETDEYDGDEDDKQREDRKAAVTFEYRSEDGKVRTKTVDGKNLSAKYFAYVGDPTKTETWKLPIHDKTHAANAAARFNQTQDIPADQKASVLAKIKRAEKKFGIGQDDDKRFMTPEQIEDFELSLQARMRGIAVDVRYSDDQPRDENGRFAGGGSGSDKSTEEKGSWSGGMKALPQAKQQYADAKAKALAHLDRLRQHIENHAATEGKHWGHVGDMQHYANALSEIAPKE